VPIGRHEDLAATEDSPNPERRALRGEHGVAEIAPPRKAVAVLWKASGAKIATATISSALSSVVGTRRRFIDSAASEPAIMPTIQPTTTSLIRRTNIVGSSCRLSGP
jgi:hypothetical protein